MKGNGNDRVCLAASRRVREPSSPEELVRAVLDEKMEAITTVLCNSHGARSNLYEDVMAMVERSLLAIALRRNDFVKCRAADYLGINRNTFQKKVLKYGLDKEGR